MTTDPTDDGFIAAVTIPPTAISLSPDFAALSRSTAMEINGWSSDRLLDASATTPRSFTFARTASAASRSSLSLVAVMLTSMVDDANPPPAACNVTFPESAIFATALRTSACSFTWSTLGLVVSEKVAPPDPVNADRSELPLDPIDSWTVSTPVMPCSTDSTFMAASSFAWRLAPRGRVWFTVRVFWPLSPMKLVFTNGSRATVPPRRRTAARMTATGRLSVKLSTGR